MGNGHERAVDDPIAVNEDIDVEGTWPVRHIADPARVLFNFKTFLQERFRFQQRPDFNYGIEKPWLVFQFPGLGPIEGGTSPGNDASVAQDLNRQTKIRLAISNV
jgi:hypothetical protein